MLLSILIPTTADRAEYLACLLRNLDYQLAGRDAEVLFDHDPTATTGAKRNALLARAQGDYSVFIDSDDLTSPWYVDEIMTALEQQPDCVGMLIQYYENGKRAEIGKYSIVHPDYTWQRDEPKYCWPITHICPVRTELARAVGFPDQTIGEDRDYALRLRTHPHLKREVFINRVLYHYFYREDHKPQTFSEIHARAGVAGNYAEPKL